MRAVFREKSFFKFDGYPKEATKSLYLSDVYIFKNCFPSVAKKERKKKENL